MIAGAQIMISIKLLSIYEEGNGMPKSIHKLQIKPINKIIFYLEKYY